MSESLHNFNVSGRKAHIWQRLSALYLMLYIPVLAVIILNLPASQTLVALTDQLGALSYSALFFVATAAALILLFVHAWVGVRDIIIDYLETAQVKLWLTLYKSFLALLLINCIFVVINLVGA